MAEAQAKAGKQKAEANHDAAKARQDADYDVKKKCAAMSGDAKDACLAGQDALRQVGHRQMNTTRRTAMAQRIWIVLVMAVAGMTAGCNTVEGAGKDIAERGGEKIQQQAR